MNVTDAILDQAKACPAHPAIESAVGVITYGELATLIGVTITNLQDAGIRCGQIVGVRLRNSPQHIVLLCALARLGAVALPIDMRLTANEAGEMATALWLNTVIHDGVVDGLEDLSHYELSSMVPSSADTLNCAEDYHHPEFSADLPCAVIQSSGTTGKPKRRFQSHGQLAIWMQYFRRYFAVDERVRYLVNGQISFNVMRFHCFSVLGLGGTVILGNNAGDKNQLATVLDHGITFLLVPSAFQAQGMLNEVKGARPCIPDTTIMVGSSYFSADLKRQIRECLTARLFEVYAANESGLIAHSEAGDEDMFPDAVGKLIEDIDLEIVDQNDNVLPADQVGMVRVRGPHFPDAYIDDPEASALCFRDGWFYPSDLASINAHGYVFLKGRADDAISTQGVMFYPAEVESVLLQHPNIREAAVMGWPHEQGGEVAAAFVVVEKPLDGQRVLDFVRERLANWKVPRHLIHVKKLPKTPQGKVEKYKLKQVLQDRLQKPRDRDN